MASSEGKSDDENLEREVKPSAKIFFLDKKLVRLINANRGANIVYLFNITDDKPQTMLLSDFKKHRRRAYLVVDAARILNRTTMQLNLYIQDGLIKPPTGATPNGERMLTKRSYYSEDDIFEIREAMSTVHRGRPRNDGLVTNNNVLTEQELRAKMGDALMLYTRTKDGRFIPTWAEETY